MAYAAHVSPAQTLAPNVDSSPVVGFENDLLEINNRVYRNSDKLDVIPIVGMGGIGKTTLARYALHDPLALHHFHVSALVSVSQSYNKASILLCLLNSMDPSSKREFEDESSIHERVYKYLKGRRFLIVIDDIWDAQTWDDLHMVFPDDFNGSRIIITTRDVDVASYADTSSNTYAMHLMGLDVSWNLLRQKVFEDENCPPELEEIGREIAEKCRGLPLAIVVIAGVLSKLDRMQQTWKKVAINVNEAVNKSDEPVMEILSLSYTYLPHHLRSCFLYMGALPEYGKIRASKMIRLWVAEGFVKSNGSKDLEDVAEDYLEDLVKRSVVLITMKRYDGKIKMIKMHDLLRDLCLRKVHDLPTHTILVNRYSSFHSWKCFRRARVVDLVHIAFRSQDDDTGELPHLRYLALTFQTYEYISKVPGCISKLGNLQTLIISRPMQYTLKLPLGIWKRRELRNIIIWDGYLPEPSDDTCDQILPLEKLHTLKYIRGLRFSKSILKLIPNLKNLGIYYCYHNKKKSKLSEYGLNNLVHLQKLESLNLYAKQFDYNQSDLPRSLAFPVTLQKLTLGGTAIPWEDMSIIGSLPNLQTLKLMAHACHGLVWETVEGQFCQLKVLILYKTNLHDWITESCHFPRLEFLSLYYCYNLRDIPSDIGEIATLQLIKVAHCNSSLVESAENIGEEQRMLGNDLQLRFRSEEW